MTAPRASRTNPVARISMSLAILGLALFTVIKYGKAPKKEPVIPAFRSRSPSSEGNASFAWIPRYPGATVVDIRTRESEADLTYGLEFVSADAPTDIVQYFERALRRAAFTVTTRNPSVDETNIHAESADGKNVLDVGVDKVPSGARVSVAAVEK